MPLYDTFAKFNYSKNGLLAPPEVWSMFSFFRIEVAAGDIIDFVGAADVDRDGNVSYKEFVDSLRIGLEPTEAEEEETMGVAEGGSASAAGARSIGGQPAAAPRLQRQLSETLVRPMGYEQLSAMQVGAYSLTLHPC